MEDFVKSHFFNNYFKTVKKIENIFTAANAVLP